VNVKLLGLACVRIELYTWVVQYVGNESAIASLKAATYGTFVVLLVDTWSLSTIRQMYQ